MKRSVRIGGDIEIMPQSNGRPQYSKERKYRRYDLRYPVQLEFATGESITKIEAFSRNVSEGGMLLEASHPVPQNASVRVQIIIDREPIIQPIHLAAEGKVVRVNPKDLGFDIAIECSRPLMQMDGVLPAAG